jgi:hypothetical protein
MKNEHERFIAKRALACDRFHGPSPHLALKILFPEIRIAYERPPPHLQASTGNLPDARKPRFPGGRIPPLLSIQDF